MIKIYKTGSDFIKENETFLNTNVYMSCFLILDAPLITETTKTNYALKVSSNGDTLLAIRANDYPIILFGSHKCAKELAEFLKEANLKIDRFLCTDYVGNEMTEELDKLGLKMKLNLAMDFMECKEKTEETSDEVIKASEKDIQEIFQLRKLFVIDCSLIEETKIEKISQTIDGYRIIKVNNKIVAMSRISKTADSVSLKITDVYCRKDYRGNGYARKVVNACKNEILQQGKIATLNVDKKNPISNHLYASLGFKILFAQTEYTIE